MKKYEKEGLKFDYDDDPGLIKISSIVDDITAGVINEITGYSPAMYGYFFYLSVLKGITNLEIPESFEENYDYLKKINATAVAKEILSDEKYSMIFEAAKSKIEYEKNRICNKSEIDNLLIALTQLVEEYKKQVGNLDINKLADQLKEIEGITNIPDEKLVKAILEYRDNKRK